VADLHLKAERSMRSSITIKKPCTQTGPAETLSKGRPDRPAGPAQVLQAAAGKPGEKPGEPAAGDAGRTGARVTEATRQLAQLKVATLA